MERGSNYLITYKKFNKSITAMFYEEKNGTYFFKDRSGLFGVSQRAINNGDISIELIESEF